MEQPRIYAIVIETGDGLETVAEDLTKLAAFNMAKAMREEGVQAMIVKRSERVPLSKTA